jgi:4-hydroxybenzoate polyprenyltransferase
MRYEWPLAAPAAPPQLSTALPLCVDLEGTLVKTDLTAEAVLLLAKQSPWMLPQLLWRALRGWAHFKRRLFQVALPNAELLPYRAETLDFLRREHAAGRPLILISSADERMARAVADHLGIFDHVLASNGRIHCAGAARGRAIREYLGKRDFIDLGDSGPDAAIWNSADETPPAAPAGRLLEQRRADEAPRAPGPRRETSVLRATAKALRPHQWVKNLLVLLPLFLAHQVDQLAKAGTALVAMAAFCCCASAIYVLNDLLDLESDRRHPTKRRRPFAAGELSPRAGLLLSPALCSLGLAAAARFVSGEFCGLLAVYVCLTTAYSVFLKKKLALDVLLLAGLYTYRMLAGASAVDVELSQWLLAFSMFFFFSLALGKRYVELSRRKGDANETLPGRGYRSEDLSLLESLGPTSGYLAVLVLCLYLESKPVQELYANPRLLWLACPVLLYWLTRFWLLAKRREIADDPVVFALKDKASLASIALTALVVLAARI